MSSFTAQEIASALKAKKSGQGWSAICPAHEDKNPSLSISEGSNGKVLFHCHAGCSQQLVMEALSKRGIWKTRDIAQRQPSSASSTKKKVVQKLLPSLRKELICEFRQSLDGATRDHLKNHRMLSDEVIEKYQLGIIENRVTIPIFDRLGKVVDIRRWLPEFSRTEGSPKILPFAEGYGAARPYPADKLSCDQIVLVEGELDVLAAISHGIQAMTFTCGANTFGSEQANLLSQKRVTVLMDHDSAGYEGAKKRAELLMKVGCKVHLARWPSGRNQGHDITDEIRKYGIESLVKILKEARRQYPSDEYISIADVEKEKIDWLWPSLIPFGNLTVIQGDPGQGKSTTTLAIAAAGSVGTGLPNVPSCEPFNTLLFCSEDGFGNTLRPRLEMMNANLEKIHVFNGPLSLSDENGIKKIESGIIEHGARFVVIDPIQAYIGSTVDLYRTNEVRPIMQKLAAIAERHQCAIVIVMHMTKSRMGRSFQNANGSIDFIAAARSVLLVGSDPCNKSKRAMVLIKSNLAETDRAIGYKLENSCFEWTGESDLTAAKILAPEPAGQSDSKLNDAEKFLLDILSHGPIKQKEIEAEAIEQEISSRTLNRAKKNMRIRSEKRSDGWTWKLPEYDDRQITLDCQDPYVENLANLNPDDHLETQEGQGCQQVATLNATESSPAIVKNLTKKNKRRCSDVQIRN